MRPLLASAVLQGSGDIGEIGMDIIGEVWRFIRLRKKYWILPIMAIAVLFGGLIIFGQSSVLAPFIYTLF
jgi:hypothetical protein